MREEGLTGKCDDDSSLPEGMICATTPTMPSMSPWSTIVAMRPPELAPITATGEPSVASPHAALSGLHPAGVVSRGRAQPSRKEGGRTRPTHPQGRQAERGN